MNPYFSEVLKNSYKKKRDSEEAQFQAELNLIRQRIKADNASTSLSKALSVLKSLSIPSSF